MLVNESGMIGVVLAGFTNNITGSLVATMFLLLLGVVMLALVFRLSFEAAVILSMPIVLISMAYVGGFMAVGASFLIFVALLIAKNYFFK